MTDREDTTAPPAAQNLPAAPTDHQAWPGSTAAQWSDWVQQLINDTSASAEDLARHFDSPPSARQHDHQEPRP